MIGQLKAAVAAIVIAVAAIAATFLRGKAAGRKDQEDRTNAETLDALERGREAVRDGRGRDDAQQLRDNEDQW